MPFTNMSCFVYFPNTLAVLRKNKFPNNSSYSASVQISNENHESAVEYFIIVWNHRHGISVDPELRYESEMNDFESNFSGITLAERILNGSWKLTTTRSSVRIRDRILQAIDLQNHQTNYSPMGTTSH